MAFILSENQELQDFLRAAGVAPELCRRVIIDIQAEEVVRIYTEGWLNNPCLKLRPPEILGAKVIEVKPEG